MSHLTTTLTSRRTLVAIVALVVVDLALVVLAFGVGRARPGSPQAGGAATSASQSPATSPETARSTSVSRTDSGASTPSASPSTSAASTSTQPSATSLRLVALGADVAWRAVQGSCDAGGGTVEVSRDGGRSWAQASSPARVVLRLQPTSDQSASIVGAGRDCAAAAFSTTSGGARWASAGAADSWYRDPRDTTRLHTPGGAVVQPCEGQAAVVDVAPLSTSLAEALCSDGLVRATADRGGSWQQAASVPGAVALDARREAAGVTAYVLRVDPSCAGLQVARAAASTSAVGCVPGASVPASAAVALSVAGDNGWVVAGDQTWRSTDAMVTWTKPSAG